MKAINFTVKTSTGLEHYFLQVNENQSIELQIDKALAECCYCDAYELVGYTEATPEQTAEREALITEYNEKYEPVAEAFGCGLLVALQTLKDDIEWRNGKQ